MSDPTGGGQLKPQDALMYTLGEIKGELKALREGTTQAQQAQAAVNAENKREHEEFRAGIAKHESTLAVLTDSRSAERLNRSDAVQKWMVIVGIPTAIVAIPAIFTWISSSH